MNLRQIEAFKAVMTEGSVTQAAAALGVTQPAVSCLIANLEDSMGFLLFKRHRGRFQPTGEAESFLEEAEKLLTSYNRAVRAARDLRDLKSGSLRIAALPAASVHFMPRLVADFIRTRPQVKISLQTRTSPQVREWISAQLFDIGFAELPADDAAVDCDPLFLECFCAIPEHHPLAHKTAISPRDLAGEPLIIQNPEHSAHYQLKAAFERDGVAWKPQIECHLFAPACRLAAEGAGVAIVDPFTAHDFRDRGLVFRPYAPAIPYDIGLLYPALRPRSRLALEFAEALKAHVRALLDDQGPPPPQPPRRR